MDKNKNYKFKIPGISQSTWTQLKNKFPKIYHLFKESEEELITYKKAENFYRRYEEKRIAKNMLKQVPKKFKLELAVLFKAKNFLSGDFMYATSFDSNQLLIWLGDSISHGTGSKIVKDIIRDVILKVFYKFKSVWENSLSHFVALIQKEFCSTKVVKNVLDVDLSDIIPGNQPANKMSIVIPMVFFHIKKLNKKYQIKISNRGMPLVLLFNISNNKVKKVLYISKDKVYPYGGAYKKLVEPIDVHGFPLILDKKILGYLTEEKTPLDSKEMQNKYFSIDKFYANPGDVLMVPSDGIMDLINKQGKEFGVDRLIDTLIQTFSDPKLAKLPLREIKEKYYRENVRKFSVWDERFPVTGNGIHDDLTMLFIRFK